MGYPSDEIAAVRDATDLVALVGEHAADEPRRSGASWKALCPFHDEKTPSFYIYPDEGRWHCFGACSEGGDVFDFLIQAEGLSFPEAVSDLATRAGIALHPTNGGDGDTVKTKPLHDVLAAASEWYGQQLLGQRGKPGRDFLAERQYDPQVAVREFGCGYAPDGGLLDALREQGWSDDVLVQAGLARRADSGRVYEWVSNRILWTLRTHSGKVAGFSARRIFDDPSKDRIDGKYFNTTETPVFRKSRLLYGLADCRAEVRKTHRVVVVEGYTDVMALREAGITTAVAACGTAFTREHLSLLRRMVGDQGELVFAFDPDDAGRKAALKVYDLVRDSPIRYLSCITSDSGMDPDEVRVEKGVEAVRGLVRARKPLIETVVRALVERHDLTTPESKRAALDETMPVLEHIRDPLIYREYVQQVAELIGYEADEVASQSQPVSEQEPEPEPEAPPLPSSVSGDLIHLIVRDQETAERYLSDARELLPSAMSQRVLEAVEAASWDTSRTPWALKVRAVFPEDQLHILDPFLRYDLPVGPDEFDSYASCLVERIRQGRKQQRLDSLARRAGSFTTEAEQAQALKDLLQMRKEPA